MDAVALQVLKRNEDARYRQESPGYHCSIWIAYLIGHGIVRPISGMSVAMSKLAAGETTVAVPSCDARDEMGAMAQAVEVFKKSAIERVRLEAQ